MTQDLEQTMKQALDGKFCSFVHPPNGSKTIVEAKTVSKDYCPKYNFDQPEQSKRGKWDREAKFARRRLAFWTEEKTTQLMGLRTGNRSARSIGRILGTTRDDVTWKLKQLGVLSRYGIPFQ